jgi:glycine oxidase
MKPSIIIVGAGSIGLSLAWELANRDCTVTLIDRGNVGKGTTWTASGILPPANLNQATDAIDRLRGLSHQLYPRWSDRLLAETSIDIELRRCGGWYLANSPGERALLAGMTQYWNDLSIQYESVSSSQLAEREPALKKWVDRNPDSAAWWAPDEYQIRPPRLIQALNSACEKSGVLIRENCHVVDVDGVTDMASVWIDDGTTLTADHAVVSAGAWTGKVAERLQLKQSLIPIRGQILLLKTPRPLFGGIINLGNRYLIARDDGHTLVGSCEEEVGFDLSTDDQMLEQLYQFAVSLVPDLRSATRVAAWSGLRPMTFDGFPMIGRVPSRPRLWVAAGHYRSGIHLAPATAVTLADKILGKSPIVNLDAFRVGKQQIGSTEVSAVIQAGNHRDTLKR